MPEPIDYKGMLAALNPPRLDRVSKPYKLTSGANVKPEEIAAAKDRYTDELLLAKHLDGEQLAWLADEITRCMKEENI